MVLATCQACGTVRRETVDLERPEVAEAMMTRLARAEGKGRGWS